MIRRYLLHGLTLVAFLGGMASSCNEETPAGADSATTAPLYSEQTGFLLADTPTAGADSANIGLRDVNSYISGDYFCLVGQVDNRSIKWQKIWLEAEVLDSTGTVLKVDGKSKLVFRSFADRVPTQGATSFFLSLPLEDISGTPANCRVKGAAAAEAPAGPILIGIATGGVRMQRPDFNDSTKVVELAYQVQGTVENPLDMQANNPKLVFLFYGKDDEKLYYARMVDPLADEKVIKMTTPPPLKPASQTQIFYPMGYKDLPAPLQQHSIGRVDIQVFEGRQ